jgi:beta-glucanase (GH16 family)
MRTARWVHAAAALTLAALAAPATPAAPAQAAPAPAQAAPAPAPAWQPVTRADFNGDRLPSGCGMYGGPHGGPAASWYDGDQVTVSGGSMHLGIVRKPNGGRTYATGGIGCWSLARAYGKFEIRAKVPAGKGMDSYIALWPSSGGEGDWTGIELFAPNGRTGKETAYLTNGFGGGTDKVGGPVAGRYADGFHTYGFEWWPQGVRILMDGRALHTSTRSYPGKRWLAIALSSGDPLTGLPDDGTLPNEFVIDWFAISSYVPGKANPSAPASASPATSPPADPSGAPAQPPVAEQSAASGTAPPGRNAAPAAAGANDTGSRWPLVALVLGVLAVAGAGGWWYRLRRR